MFGIEPVLQKLSGEHLKHKTSISSDDVSLDIIADNFWGHNRKRTYFDVRIFNPFCSTFHYHCYRHAEMEKKRAHEQRIHEVEFGSFSPLVFSMTGGLGPNSSVQETGINDRRQAGATIQQNIILASLQFELLTPKIC